MKMDLSLSKRIAVVTGSGRGLGAATALRLAELGADVVVNDLNAQNAEATARAVTEKGRRAHVSAHEDPPPGEGDSAATCSRSWPSERSASADIAR